MVAHQAYNTMLEIKTSMNAVRGEEMDYKTAIPPPPTMTYCSRPTWMVIITAVPRTNIGDKEQHERG